MKKNMLAVLILILTLVNVSLTAFTVFIVVPNAQRTDELITKVLTMIDLELESPAVSNYTVSYDIKNVVKYDISDLTANLKTGEDGKAHYAVINCSLSMDKENSDYAELSPLVESMQSDITAIIKNQLLQYTKEDIDDVEIREEVRKAILADIQSLFDSKFVVDFVLDILTQ